MFVDVYGLNSVAGLEGIWIGLSNGVYVVI